MDTRIRLITKEKFYSIIPIEDKKFRKIPCQENFIEDPNFRYQRYFMIDNYPFAWIKDYNLILIPESFPEELDSFIISEGIFTLQNWKIAKINDQVPYIRNEYTRTSGLAEFEDWYYEEGEYEIIDTSSGEKYKVSVLVKAEGGYYSYESFFFKDTFDKVMKDLGYTHQITTYADSENYNYNIVNGERVGQMRFLDTLEDFIEARFNRECWEIPELNEACELLDGRLFSCSLIGPDEAKKKFKQAVITIARPEDIENPSEDLKKALDVAYNYLGGNKIKFNSVKVKVKYEISNE